MSGDAWFKFYPSDWLAQTRGLSPAETGVYITLVAMMYERGGPIDIERSRLARLCGCPAGSFERIIDALIDARKIAVSESGIWSDDVGEALGKRAELVAYKAKASRARWSKQDKKTQEKQQDANADAMHVECYTRTRNQNIPLTPKNGGEEQFEEFWKAYPKREGGNPRKTALKAYLAKRKAGATHAEIMAALRAFCREQEAIGKIGSCYIPMASTWLNREEWDQPAERPEKPNATETRIEVWRQATRIFAERGVWPLADRSPAPDRPGTLVPAAILAEFGFDRPAAAFAGPAGFAPLASVAGGRQ